MGHDESLAVLGRTTSGVSRKKIKKNQGKTDFSPILEHGL
jgi:hypothetical protein